MGVSMSNPVAIIMGSDSDLEVMKVAKEILQELKVEADLRVISAHRTPEEMVAFAKEAKSNGYKVIIAGAGGAAHLPGMVASLTTLPVIGVPVPLRHLDGLDSLLSIVQMPAGIPVATVGVGNAKNAGLLAARILGISDLAIENAIAAYAQKNRNESLAKDEKVNHAKGSFGFLGN
jgi:phosphoribosylaminoimidazole carboxylase PurE protein